MSKHPSSAGSSSTSSIGLPLAFLVEVVFLVSLFGLSAALARVGASDAYRLAITYTVVGVAAVDLFRRLHPGDTPRHVLAEHAPLVVSAVLLAQVIGAFVFLVVTRFFPEPPFRWPVGMSVPEAVVYVATCTAVVGVVEEVVFRGVLQPALCSRFGMIQGVGRAAIAFGTAHLLGGYGVAGVLCTTATGAVFGAVCVKSNSVWPAALVHAMTNALVLAGASSPAAAQLMVVALLGYVTISRRRRSTPVGPYSVAP